MMHSQPKSPASHLAAPTLDYAMPQRRRLTIGLLTLWLAGLSLLFALWDIAAFCVDAFPKTALNYVPFLGTPLLCFAGFIAGAIGWIARRKTDGDRCLLGAIVCLAAFIGSSFAIGRVLSGYR